MTRLFRSLAPLALCLVLGLPGVACAQEAGAKATTDQQAAITQMLKAYRQETQALRVKLDAARIELNALSNNPNADPKRIEFLAGEIATLRAQLAQKQQDFRETAQRKFPGAFNRPGPRSPQQGQPRVPNGAPRHHLRHGWSQGGYGPCGGPCYNPWLMGPVDDAPFMDEADEI